jgi:hypothetical protein
MTQPEASPRGLRARVRRLDPHHDTLHRALRLAIVNPVLLFLGAVVVGNAQLASFATFGGAAMLLFADFPGDRFARAAAYLGLTAAGALMITLGTVLADPWWLAGLSMVVVGFAVNFAGVLSATVAAAGRACLLAFILSVTLPGGLGDVGPRLLGWLLAAALSIPAVLFFFPARYHDKLRTGIALSCRSVAAQIRDGAPERTDLRDRARADVHTLRDAFNATETRPVGLSTGSRFLIRIIDDIGWLRAGVAAAVSAQALDGVPPSETAELRCTVADLLETSADAIDPDLRRADRAAARDRLDIDLQRAVDLRQQLGRRTLTALARTGGDRPDQVDGPLPAAEQAIRDLEMDRTWHAVVHAARLTGATIAVASAADARPVQDRLLGKHPPTRPGADPIGIWPAARRIAAGEFAISSVAFRNAVRVGLGLGLAIMLAEGLVVDHAFWVALGAMSVLRSRALATTTNALRALTGTAVGFAVGAALILLFGTSPAVLWPVVPVALFFAGLSPTLVSYLWGQAGFTVQVLAAFNILQPTGWSVGVVRIEDVALGCGASLVAGLIAWPRGARGAVDAAIRHSLGAAAHALRRVLRGGHDLDPNAVKAANTRADDALRGLLAEQSGKVDSVAHLNSLVTAGTRIRLTTEAIAPLADHVLAGTPLDEDAGISGKAPRLPAHRPLRRTRPTATDAATEVITALTGADDPGSQFVLARAETIADTLQQFTGGLTFPSRPAWMDRPGPSSRARDEELLDALRTLPIDRAASLLWIDLYLDDLERMLRLFAGAPVTDTIEPALA